MKSLSIIDRKGKNWSGQNSARWIFDRGCKDFFLARPHLRKKNRRRYSKCRRGWEIGSFADKQCRVGTWSEVGGCFSANAAGGMRPRAGEDGRVGMRKDVQGWFAANAAWGMLSMTGMADASARGGTCGAGLPQMRPGDAADGGGRWTRRHTEGRVGLVCRKCGLGDAVDDGDGGRVGTRRGVRGWFAANAAGGCGRWRGKMDASARGVR